MWGWGGDTSPPPPSSSPPSAEVVERGGAEGARFLPPVAFTVATSSYTGRELLPGNRRNQHILLLALYHTPSVHFQRKKINKWDYIWQDRSIFLQISLFLCFVVSKLFHWKLN